MLIEQIRTFRVFGYAVFDLSLAFAGMWLISPVLNRLFYKAGLDIPKITWLLWTLPLGNLVHLLLRVNTPMTKSLLVTDNNYLLKFVMLGLFVAGLFWVKK